MYRCIRWRLSASDTCYPQVSCTAILFGGADCLGVREAYAAGESTCRTRTNVKTAAHTQREMKSTSVRVRWAETQQHSVARLGGKSELELQQKNRTPPFAMISAVNHIHVHMQKWLSSSNAGAMCTPNESTYVRSDFVLGDVGRAASPA